MGNPTDAITYCERVLRLNPSYVRALSTLGSCYQTSGEQARAAECFERAISLQPQQVILHLNLASSLQELGRLSEAESSYRRSLTLNPESTAAHEGLGQTLLAQGRRKESIHHFMRALELEPDSVRLLLQLSEVQGRLGLTAESIALTKRALTLEPNSGPAHCQLGFRMQDSGDFPAAIDSFERSIREQPVQSQAFFGLATSKKIVEQDGSLIERVMGLVTAKSLPPIGLMQLHTALSKAFDDLGQYELAVRHMDEANRIALTGLAGTGPFERAGVNQYVSDAIRAFTAEFLAENSQAGLQTELPLLIVGMPRSGTTLIEQIISAHPQVAAGGELRFWSDAHTEQEKGLISLAFDGKKAGGKANDYLTLLSQIGPHAQRVTDKMPNNFFHIGVIHLLFPKARFIHCRRNPLDNCVSLYMTPYRHRPAYAQTREDIVFYYRNYLKLMKHWRMVLPAGRILEVDYEDVVANKEAATRRVLDFCGLGWDDACLQHEKNERTVNTPSAWQTRQRIYNTSIERWKRYEPWLGALKEAKLLEPAT
jgi:tetratricopeptide (TPR) repeat protein